MKGLAVLFTILFLSTSIANAQSAGVTIEPVNYSDPSTPLKIIVNLNEIADQSVTHVQNLLADADANLGIYFWTWKPYEFPAGSPKANGIGAQAWKNSNELLLMTKESDRVYSFTLTPTEFYEVSPATVYLEDIHFLVKPKDGGGFGDPDRKSPDLMIDILDVGIERISSQKITAFPQPANESLTINLTNGDAYSIFDLSGNLVVRGTYTSTQTTIATSTWSNGIYLLQVTNNKEIVNKKICVAH
jgi:hypothetical protein